MPRCVGFKPTGEQCTRIVGTSQSYCYAHDPSCSEQRREAASKAARSKTDVEIGTIKRELKEAIERVLEGSIDKGRGSVAFQGYGVLIRAIELERKIREQEELVERIETLERTQGKPKGGRWGA